MRNGQKLETIIDTEDLQKLIDLDLCWHVQWFDFTQSYYVATTKQLGNNKSTTIKLHSIIMNAKPRQKIDHKNHDTLDNRKENLRFITTSQNGTNRKGANKNSGTGHRNVNWGSKRKEYLVQFCKNGERYKWVFPLNQFKEACEFADIKRIEIFGEFAGEN